MANVLVRMANYDLGPAYRWWQRLPLWALGVLYLPAIYVPTVVTDLFAIYIWKMAPHGVFFGWLFSAMGHIVTVLLAWALARRWRPFFSFAAIVVRMYTMLESFPGDYAGLLRGYPIVGKYLFLLPIIEIFTAIVSIFLLWKIWTGAWAGKLPPVCLGGNGVDSLSIEQRSASIRFLWLALPEWIRWVYCWGIIGAPAVTFSYAIINEGGSSPFIFLFRLYPGLIYAFLSAIVIIPRFGLLCSYFILSIAAIFSVKSWCLSFQRMIDGGTILPSDSSSVFLIIITDGVLYIALFLCPIIANRLKI